jgi:hypothetical protein
MFQMFHAYFQITYLFYNVFLPLTLFSGPQPMSLRRFRLSSRDDVMVSLGGVAPAFEVEATGLSRGGMTVSRGGVTVSRGGLTVSRGGMALRCKVSALRRKKVAFRARSLAAGVTMSLGGVAFRPVVAFRPMVAFRPVVALRLMSAFRPKINALRRYIAAFRSRSEKPSRLSSHGGVAFGSMAAFRSKNNALRKNLAAFLSRSEYARVVAPKFMRRFRRFESAGAAVEAEAAGMATLMGVASLMEVAALMRVASLMEVAAWLKVLFNKCHHRINLMALLFYNFVF